MAVLEVASEPLLSEPGPNGAELFVTHDLVWREAATGANSRWEMLGPEVVRASAFPSVADPAFDLQAIADFNGDGKEDYLWRHATGPTSFWFMDGDRVLGMEGWAGVPGPPFRVVASADFNRDGHADIVWRDDSTGDHHVWLMNRTVATSAFVLPNPRDIGWAIRGAGDLDGDGDPDLVWQHTAGMASVWFMDGTKPVRAESFPLLTPDWMLSGVADIDTDGRADLVWRHLGDGTTPGTGATFVWYMNGATLEGFTKIATVAPRYELVGLRRRSLAPGMTAAASPDTPTYAQGVRQWAFVPGAKSRTYVLAADGVGTRFFTSFIAPTTGHDYEAMTVEELAKLIELRAFVSTRYQPLSVETSAQMLEDVEADTMAPGQALRLDEGFPMQETWRSCNAELLAVFHKVMATSRGVMRCKLAVKACTVAAGLSAPVAALCGATLGVGACAQAVARACALNQQAATLACCVGEDTVNWLSWPTCEVPGRFCSCASRNRNDHLEIRGFAFFEEYRCMPGKQYSVALVETVDAVTFGGPGSAGPSCATPRTFRKRSYVRTLPGDWDAPPSVELGYYDNAWQCDAGVGHRRGLIKGKSYGQPQQIEVELYSRARQYLSTVYNGEQASTTKNRIVCQGFDTYGSPFRSCAAELPPAETHDLGCATLCSAIEK